MLSEQTQGPTPILVPEAELQCGGYWHQYSKVTP